VDAEAYLDSLEPIGWKLGLERMHRLTTLLGMPQHRFASVHVVGTNGKSSVARMVAALLEAHGVAAGASVSPHQRRWSERVLVGGEEIAPERFAAAVTTTAEAAETVNRHLAVALPSAMRKEVRPRAEGGEVVTQFEVATGAAFLALARARVEAAAIEAGLGGRLDATNTIPSRITVLTSVGLDHTQWLGGTEEEIAAEKLAVLRDGSALVLGRVSPAVESLARRAAAERGATLVVAPEDPGPGVVLGAAGRFQRRNFAAAAAAAEAFLGEALDPDRVAAVATAVEVPGRLERVADEPPTFLDAAHNPQGAAALAEALPEVARGRPVVACLAMLADKDAGATVEALAPALEQAVCTELPASALRARGLSGAASHPAAELARACAAAGVAAEAEPCFEAAIGRGRELAAAGGGLLLVAGSNYARGPARAALGR
jgi:dihydrofolate synthase/folylpolyglutamate synthase